VLDLAAQALCRQHPGHELLLADHHAIVRVVEQVLDGLGRVGVVDRERCCPKVHDGRVDQMEFGAVGQHDRHGVAGLDPEPGQAGGDRLHPGRVLAPGDRDRTTQRAHGDRVGIRRGGLLERPAHRCALAHVKLLDG
jgi:hypothetical protein